MFLVMRLRTSVLPSMKVKSATQGVLSGLLAQQKGDIYIDGEKRTGKSDKAFLKPNWQPV